MRRLLNFSCEGIVCTATLDHAEATTGLLIVSGGNEIRIATHQGMARLADEVAVAGYPVFRFDRRSVGDSEGENHGFESSGPDIRAALATFRAEEPQLRHIVALGNCDGATALALYRPEGLAALILTNPWIVEVKADEPAPAAARAYYAARLRNPRAWLNVLRGRVNVREAATSLSSAVAGPSSHALADRFASALAQCPIPIKIVHAIRDGTAIAFATELDKARFDAVRAKVKLVRVDSASHSFASTPDHELLRGRVLNMLAQAEADPSP